MGYDEFGDPIETYVIIADYESMFDDSQKQYGLQVGEYDDYDDAYIALQRLRSDYWEHGYSNMEIEVKY